MGRLSDARKKAKAKQAEGTTGSTVGADPIAPPEAPVEAPAVAADFEADDAEFEYPSEPSVQQASAGSATKLPSSGLADEILGGIEPKTKLPPSGLADDILAAVESKPAKPRKLPASSGLADEILGELASATPPVSPAPAKKKLPASSGLADDILAAATAPNLADEILQGIEDDKPSDGALAGQVLAAMGGDTPAQAGDEPPLDHGFEAGVLDVLLDAPRPAPRALPSSGLAEDILHDASARKGRTPLALDEIHEFESFFEDERHEIEQLHLVLFRVATEQFAVEIDRVHEVIRVPAITRVPHLASHIRGVVNLRGRIVPVMDLRLLMNLPPRPIDRMSRIMVLDLAKKQIGILVDLVSEVMHVSVADVEPPPDEMRAIDRNLVTAVARAAKRMIFILDMDKVLALK